MAWTRGDLINAGKINIVILGKVVVLMEHVAKAKDGSTAHKILDACNLPLTGVGVVNRIITDLGVLDVTPHGLKVVELAPGASQQDIITQIGASLNMSALY